MSRSFGCHDECYRCYVWPRQLTMLNAASAADVGKAVANSGLPRDELFITTKIYARDWGYRRARAAVQRSLGC